MVDNEVTSGDVAALDPIYFRNRIEMILQPGGIELMQSVMMVDELRFLDMDEDFNEGAELKPGGKDILVTEENKAEYAMLVSERYLCGKVPNPRHNFNPNLSFASSVVRCDMRYLNSSTDSGI